MELDTLGDRKTALFLIMSDTDTTFNFILAMLQSQLINLLCDRADDVYGGRLPVHVRLILDEFANILEEFDRYIFESIVEKVIVGGYDEEGRKDPAKLIFIYKTGFQSHMDGANFKPPRKNSKSAKQAAGLCSHPTDKVETTCSHHSDDTCGIRGSSIATVYPL